MIYWILAIIVAFVILFFVCNRLYIRTTYYKNIGEFENTYNKNISISSDLEMVNFGSVFGRFAFEYIDNQKGYNFAMSPQPLSYDYRILKEYIGNIKEGALVVFTLPVFIFALVDYDDDRKNSKYYSYLSKNSILNYSKWKYIKYYKYPVLTAGKNVLHIIKDSKYKNYMGARTSNLSRVNIETNALNRTRGWCKQFGLKNTLENSMPDDITSNFEVVVKTLNDMIQFCLHHKLHPLLVSTPFSAELNKHFSKEFVEAMFYENIKKANKANIPYLDYREHSDFQDRYEWFINGCDWLTKDGREHFMEILKKDIENKNIL